MPAAIATATGLSRGYSQGVHVPGQTAFQVGCFVAVDVAAFSQLVDHADHFRQEGSSFRFVFQFAQILNCRTCRFFVVTVLQAALIILTDALERGFMVCHVL